MEDPNRAVEMSEHFEKGSSKSKSESDQDQDSPTMRRRADSLDSAQRSQSKNVDVHFTPRKSKLSNEQRTAIKAHKDTV